MISEDLRYKTQISTNWFVISTVYNAEKKEIRTRQKKIFFREAWLSKKSFQAKINKTY